jgi:cell division transport system permease protein
MRLEYYFKETAAGLRRNGIVAFAAMSTAFIALFLFGLSLLIAREFNLVIDAWTGNVQVAVYLNDPARPDTIKRIQDTLQALPAVSDEGGSIEYWDKTKTCEQYDRLFEGQAVFQEGVNCEEAIPTSFRINLADSSQYGQITAALTCVPGDQGQIACSEPGVRNVSDFRNLLDRLTTITKVLQVGVLSIAAIMLASAIALVANTLRMGMFARRKEIGIMRLVGATNWRIRVPFLIEGLVEALLGAAAAIVALFLLKVVFIDRLRGEVQFFPLIKNSDVLSIAPWILIAAAAVAIIAGTIGMRRFLDV